MCTILFAIDSHPDFRLILLANRDEFYDRPTRALAHWTDHPDVRAGRDLVAGGTWLGITDSGRFAAVTNYRDPAAPRGTRSRGMLTADFLTGKSSPIEYLEGLKAVATEFSGFNLLVGSIDGSKTEAFYYSNRNGDTVELSTGIYGLSNAFLDSAWPKVARGKDLLATELRTPVLAPDRLFAILEDDIVAPDDLLPDTGIGHEREKALSSIFIRTPSYGTRSSTVLTVRRNGKIDILERVFV